MSQVPVSQEVARALAAFFTGGTEPRHAVLSRVFHSTGFGDVAPYRPPDMEPNNENRVRDTITVAIRWELTDDGELRPSGVGVVSSVVGRPAIED